MPEKKLILAVDDDRVTLELLVDILSNDGFRVIPLCGGQSVLHEITMEIPALILLDVNMPVIDGHEVCRRIKKIPAFREIPVIFVSGVQHHGEIAKCYALGAVDFISKPFCPDELLDRVRIHLNLNEAESLNNNALVR